MNISVILPTYQAEPYLPELLKRLKGQSTPPHEIIVVDSSSTDRTVEIAKHSGAKVLVINKEEFDHGGTRNYAAQEASGEVLAFMTQDALPEGRDFLASLTGPLRDSQVAAVCGRQIARANANVLEQMTREINYPEEMIRKSFGDLKRYGIKLFFFTNVCSAIRRDAFMKLGGFPEPIILNEDMILAAKCILSGYSIVYNPDAGVIHSHDYTLMGQFRRNFDIGVSMRMNDWIFQYTTAEREGRKLVKQQLSRLWRGGHWRWIPRWFAEAAAKYAGYRLGLSYRSLPMRLRRKFSMHAGFWLLHEDKLQSHAYQGRTPSA
ncbi:glycosyltransferase family 2 protein [Cohnella nanjingensis]|uniref:Glycosyltransferase family 2 protein n=1 Tax=Cohnella nanjingensis TaxID=1387779 RepID=A0A7X0RN72_9BACL|nr:glycosyltransferase family 2 protein [Cohnella nanjingensis]MBB6670617.1 glycosyltransferase family 2 protein [Cohnella nanjingensis]